MYLPPALAEEVIFSVVSTCASVCVSVCALQAQAEPLDLRIDLKFGICIKDYHISNEFEGQDHRSKVQVTKVKNVKKFFSLVSENVVRGHRGEGHQGQGHQGQSHRSMSEGSRSKLQAKVKVARVKVKKAKFHGGLLCVTVCLYVFFTRNYFIIPRILELGL